MAHRGNRFTFRPRFLDMFVKPIEIFQFGFVRHIHGRLYQHISGDNRSFVLSDILWLHLFQDRIDLDFVHVGLSLWGISDTKTSKPEKDRFWESDSDSTFPGDFGLFAFVFGSFSLCGFSL